MEMSACGPLAVAQDTASLGPQSMDLLGDSVQPQAANAKDSSYSTAHTSRKQKLALRWHDGSKGLAITTEGQLHYLFERFPMTYSAHECEQLLLALHKTGKIHSSKSAILDRINASRSHDRVRTHAIGKRSVDTASAHSSRVNAESQAVSERTRSKATRLNYRPQRSLKENFANKNALSDGSSYFKKQLREAQLLLDLATIVPKPGDSPSEQQIGMMTTKESQSDALDFPFHAQFNHVCAQLEPPKIANADGNAMVTDDVENKHQGNAGKQSKRIPTGPRNAGKYVPGPNARRKSRKAAASGAPLSKEQEEKQAHKVAKKQARRRHSNEKRLEKERQYRARKDMEKAAAYGVGAVPHAPNVLAPSGSAVSFSGSVTPPSLVLPQPMKTTDQNVAKGTTEGQSSPVAPSTSSSTLPSAPRNSPDQEYTDLINFVSGMHLD